MASFLARAIPLIDGAGANLFDDDDGSTHEDNIDRLATAGVTLGCGGTMYCPDADVRRDQMASFLARALDLTLLVPPNPSQGWSRALGADANATPALTATRIIGGSSAGMFATDRAGNEVWTNDIAIDFSSPFVHGDLVVVGSTDGNVYGLDLADGTVSWSYDTGSLVNSSPTVDGDDVFIGSSSGSLYSLDAATGAFNWAFAAGVFSSSPVVVDGVVYVGSQDDNVYAIDAALGTEVWSFTTGDLILISSPTVVDGVVYIGSFDSTLYALDTDDGTELWSATVGGAVRSSPAVSEGIVVVGSNDSSVYAFDAATGDPLWSFATGDWVEASPVIDLGGVFVPSNDGNVYVLRLTDGTVLWSEWLAGPIRSGAAVDGRLIVVGVGGSVEEVATISY